MLLMIILNQIIIILLPIYLFYSSLIWLFRIHDDLFMQKIKFYLLNFNKFLIMLISKKSFIWSYNICWSIHFRKRILNSNASWSWVESSDSSQHDVRLSISGYDEFTKWCMWQHNNYDSFAFNQHFCFATYSWLDIAGIIYHTDVPPDSSIWGMRDCSEGGPVNNLIK
jgi:hypothetical protein